MTTPPSEPITEESIRARLAVDAERPSRLATWEEIAFLLSEIDTLRDEALEDEMEIERLLRRGAAIEGLLPEWEQEIDEHTRGREFGIAEGLRIARQDVRDALSATADG